MLLYGAARDPATCKPTKDSEIAAARVPRLRVLSSSLYFSSLAHTCSRSPHCLFYPLTFLFVDRSQNTAGQYRNAFTAIWSRRQNLARSSAREGSRAASEECFLSDLASSRSRARLSLETWSISLDEQTEEEKDCSSGAWIELLTIGLLCRGAFQPCSRFKASVDSRLVVKSPCRHIYTYHHRNIIILPGARYLKEGEREGESSHRCMINHISRRKAPILRRSERTLFSRLFIGLERVRCCLYIAGNIGRKQPRDNRVSLSRVCLDERAKTAKPAMLGMRDLLRLFVFARSSWRTLSSPFLLLERWCFPGGS